MHRVTGPTCQWCSTWSSAGVHVSVQAQVEIQPGKWARRGCGWGARGCGSQGVRPPEGLAVEGGPGKPWAAVCQCMHEAQCVQGGLCQQLEQCCCCKGLPPAGSSNWGKEEPGAAMGQGVSVPVMGRSVHD